MNDLTKIRKVILIIILSIILGIGFVYYIYSERDKDFIEEQNIELSQSDEPKVEEENLIKVHISGAVNNEGVIELKENSRIVDAIEKAGGYRKDAYTDEINLAYILEDGVKVYIPTKEEHEKQIAKGQENEEDGKQQSSVATKEISTGSTIDTKTSKKSKININTASQNELETLPGIGESTALKIINYRDEKGKFKTIEAIKEVSGIGESKFNKIKDLISV